MLLLLLLPWLMVTSMALEIGDQELLRAMVQEMREEMEDKFVKVEQEAAATKSELESMKVEAAAMMSKIEILEMEAAATKSSMSSLPSTISQVVRDLPVLTTCAFRDYWPTPSSTITYERLITDYNNSDRPGGADGILDISTGVFHCLCPGHYTVTYSGKAYLESGERTVISIYMNNADLGYEGKWDSSATGTGLTRDQGSRTIVSIL